MGMRLPGVALHAGDDPLDPDADEARDLLSTELEKTRYQEAPPTEGGTDWLAEILDRIRDMLNSLDGENSVDFWAVAVVIVVLALIIAAFVIFGIPRLRARSVVVSAAAMFEAEDRRASTTMRRDAEAAARRGDYRLATAERFRTIARALHERTLVSTVPGSTAHDVARRAAHSLPEFRAELAAAATDFDAVRYLGNEGDAQQYQRMADLDTALSKARPTSLETEAPLSVPGAPS